MYVRLAVLISMLAALVCSHPVSSPPPPAGPDVKRFGDAPTYVDGVPRGVLRFAELPPALEPAWRTLSDGRLARRYRLADYVTALGVDLSHVREVHVHGGRNRVARVTGSELVRASERLLFSFSQGTRGKPRMHWAADVGITDAIDTIVALAIYVERDPPRWSVEKWRLELGGEPVDGIAYVDDELRGGTRVYLDGRFTGVLKKRNLPADAPLASALATIGVDLSGIASADVIADDVRVSTLDARQLSRQRLVPVPQSGGRMSLAPSGATGTTLLLHARTE